MKKFVLSAYIVFGMLMFSFVGAADNTPPNPTSGTCTMIKDVPGILNWASCVLLKSVIPLLFTLALVAFIWGVIQFYLNPDNEEKRKKGKNFIVGGIIALFVMLSVWGLVGILTGTFQLGNTLPQLPGQ